MAFFKKLKRNVGKAIQMLGPAVANAFAPGSGEILSNAIGAPGGRGSLKERRQAKAALLNQARQPAPVRDTVGTPATATPASDGSRGSPYGLRVGVSPKFTKRHSIAGGGVKATPPDEPPSEMPGWVIPAAVGLGVVAIIAVVMIARKG